MLLPRTSRALPRIGTAFGTALALLALSGEPALAAGSTLTGDGLHISTGALVDPVGRTWVADHNAGFCRMTEPTETTAGHVEHPQHPGDPGERTCLGGLLPDAGLGPDAAGQPVFVDPTPDWVGNGDEVALIPDGASPSSEVVRAQWNPNTKKFEFRDTITMIADRGRPTVLSLGPDDAVYVGFQRETRIQRIVDPAADVPQVEIVGNTSDGRAPQIVAAGRDQAGETAIYVAETGGLRMLHPDAGTVPTTEAAPFAVDPALAIGSMYYDLDSDFLYIGTANGVTGADAGIDTVTQVDARTGFVDPTPFATGFSMVGGIGKAPNGFLYVLDDPALLDPAEPIGTGRLFHVGLPAAHVTAGPLDNEGRTGTDRHSADATPTFSVAGDGAIECRLRGEDRDSGWQACGIDTGTFAVSEEHPLADGAYTLSVRATQDEVTGLAEHLRFTVDTTKPQRPVVKRPAADKPVSGSPWFEFFSDEEHVAYECSFDLAEAFTPCRPGRTASYEVQGDHTLQIVAIDRAGNRSDPSDVARFSVDPSLPPTPAPGWGEGPAKYKGSSLVAGGLHISTGAIVDPDGRTWVSDHNGGFCRTTPAGEDGAGTIDHPALPGDAGPRTCLGGLLPEAGTGPDAAGQPAFIDPSPDFHNSGDEFVLIPDGASPSSDVVRADWNPDTGLFEFRDIVTMNADTTEDRPRPVAVSAAPDGNAYVVFQRSGTVQRIVDPESPTPTVDLVAATSDGRGASGVAATYGPGGPLSPPRIVVAEATGLREVVGTATPDPAAPRTTVDSGYDLPGGATPPVVSALTYEVRDATAGTGDLYAGTADSLPAAEGDPNADRVLRWTGAGQPSVVTTGLSSVGGFGPRHHGGLLVLDDPALVLPGEPLGTGRMYSIGAAWARVTGGPQNATRETTPTFTLTGEGARECSIDGGTPQSCGASFTTGTLTEGAHTLAVRAAGAPAAEIRRFRVDTTAPSAAPKIMSPATGTFTSVRPYFEFEPADGEEEGTYECKLVRVTDPATEGAFAPCDEGRPNADLAAGDYTMVIRARDAAGNPVAFDDSTPVSTAVTFTVGTPAPGPDVPAAPNGPLTAPNSVVRLADGLHISTGAFEAPDGSLWVADHNAGLCRVSKPTFDGAGHIEHPSIPGEAGPNSCLGGLLPEAREGADAAGQPVLLDPTPRNPGSGDEVVLVPDGARPSSSLFRAQWNPGTNRFDPLGAIDGPLDNDADTARPTAVAVGPDPDGPNGDEQPDVFFVRKRDNLVVRVRGAAGANPQVDVVGSAAGRQNFEAMAVGQRTVNGTKEPVIYIGEANGVTRLIPREGQTPVATPITLQDFTGSVGALAYDKARDILYVGTADAAGDPAAIPPVPGVENGDRVVRFSVGDTDTETPSASLVNQGAVGQFNMVGGLGVRPDGHVLVTDDVALTLPDEPIGTGRLYQIGSPQAHVASGPTGPEGKALDSSFTSDNTPEFTVEGDGPFECVVRKDGVTPVAADWKPCASPVSAATLLGTASVADGTYVLSVRSTAGAATPEAQNDTSLFVPESKRFTVDTQAPGTPSVAVAQASGRSNAAPWFTFAPAGADHAADLAWRCKLNDETAFSACHPGRTYPLNNDGTSKLRDANTIEVKAVDKAGNESASAGQRNWNADTSIPKVTITAPGAPGATVVRQQSTSATFRLAVQDGDAPTVAQTGCRLDGAVWKLCNRDGETFNGLAEGTHVFKAHARDAFGNMSPTAIRRVIVDRTGPTIAINGLAGLTGPSATATFSVAAASQSEGEGAIRFFCSLDNATPAECPSTITMGGLTDGTHTLTVTGLDDVGNAGAPQSVTWTVSGAPAPQTPPNGGPGPGQGGGQGGGQGQGRGRGGLAVAQVAPTIQAAALRAGGLPVTVRPQAGATAVRIRVFRVAGATARAAAVSTKAAKRQLVATVYRATPKAKTYRFRLKERKLRTLKPGRYVVEIRAGASRNRLGAATTRTMVVRGR
jgi:hypothetical protein